MHYETVAGIPMTAVRAPVWRRSGPTATVRARQHFRLRRQRALAALRAARARAVRRILRTHISVLLVAGALVVAVDMVREPQSAVHVIANLVVVALGLAFWFRTPQPRANTRTYG